MKRELVEKLKQISKEICKDYTEDMDKCFKCKIHIVINELLEELE